MDWLTQKITPSAYTLRKSVGRIYFKGSNCGEAIFDKDPNLFLKNEASVIFIARYS